MKISKSSAATARRLFGLCQSAGRLDESKLRTVVDRIVADKPRDYRQILAALLNLARLDINRRKVTVESAVELDEAARQRISSGLAKQYGTDLDLHYQVTPDLIGGLRIRVGDDVLDGSVKGRLDRLASAF